MDATAKVQDQNKLGRLMTREKKTRKKKTRTIELEATRLPPIIPSSSLLSHTTLHHVLNTSLTQSRPKVSQPQLHNPASQPQPRIEVSQPQLHNIESQPQSNQFQPTNTFTEPMMSPPTNATPATSCTVVGDDNDDNRVWIVPEADGFDPHKPVITGIADCIRSKFELARPSWKKYPQSTRDMWFDEFKKKFRWLPHHTDAIRRNFEKRAAAKMTQLFQDFRKDLTVKPEWIGDAVFKEMKEYWESPEYKAKSEQNKKNREANAGASVHTGGCIPHRLIYKRMKEATGKDPSLSDFYFRTHRKEKDKSWVNEKAEARYNNFAQKKEELLASQNALVEGETNPARQPSQVSKVDIWMMSVGGKKKGRVAGLGSLGRAMRAPTQSTSATQEEVNEIITSKVQDSTAELYNQLQEERRQNKEMRRQNKKMKKELGVTNKKLDALVEHLHCQLPSCAQSSSSEDSQSSESDENNDQDNF